MADVEKDVCVWLTDGWRESGVVRDDTDRWENEGGEMSESST